MMTTEAGTTSNATQVIRTVSSTIAIAFLVAVASSQPAHAGAKVYVGSQAASGRPALALDATVGVRSVSTNVSRRWTTKGATTVNTSTITGH